MRPPNRRIGTFCIDGHLVTMRPEVVRGMLGDMLVLRAEQDWASDRLRYMACCEAFDEVEEGQMVPEYTPVFDSRKWFVEWRKQ